MRYSEDSGAAMNELLDRYGELLCEVDNWFAKCTAGHPQDIKCHLGCAACCRGLFDITMLDAAYLKRGVDRLEEAERIGVICAANERLQALSRKFPSFTDPWLLNLIEEPEWDAIMPEDDEDPCLLLSGRGICMAYEYRPMTCRLHGIPLIDVSGENLFDELCTLNFAGKNPLIYEDIRFGFNELFAQELLLFQEFIRMLTGRTLSETDTIIPAAILLDLDRVAQAVRVIAGDDHAEQLPVIPAV
jgi:Fe-S-cluster containining protein